MAILGYDPVKCGPVFFFFMLLLLVFMSWNDKVQDGAILSTDNANLLCRTTLNNLRNCYFTKRVDGKCVNTLDSVSSLSAKLLRTQTDINRKKKFC